SRRRSLRIATRLCENNFSGYSRPKVIDSEAHLKLENGRRSIERLLKPLLGLAAAQYESLGVFEAGSEKYSLPRFTLRGPNSSDPIRIGIFATIHGDEPAGALATAQFIA